MKFVVKKKIQKNKKFNILLRQQPKQQGEKLFVGKLNKKFK